MPLPTFKTKDEIPEAFRAEYVERNGEWHPNIEDVTGLKESQRRALNEKKALEEQLKNALGDMSADEVADLRKKHREIEEAQARKAGDFDKLLEKRVLERDAEWQKKFDAVAPYKTKYEDRELESAIRKAAIPAGVDAKDLEEYVIPLVKNRRIKLDGDKIVVLDRDGDPTGLTPEKFFAEAFKQEAPKFYSAAGGSGGGATQGNGRSVAVAGTVSMRDNNAFIASVDKIAKGEIKAV